MARGEEALRLNRFLARAGFGSRRAVEELIRQGRVTLAGEVVRDLGRRVEPSEQGVAVDGRAARLPQDFRIYAFHKPLHVVSTLKAQGGQPALLAYRLQADLPDRFVPVGRLDSESTGLLLWTDDGALNQQLCKPRSRVWKTYEIELNGPLGDDEVARLTNGSLRLDGRACRPAELVMQPEQTNRHWIMRIHEGRRRQIRRMMREVDRKVLRLHRTSVGPIELGLLHPGDFRRLTHRETRELRAAARGES